MLTALEQAAEQGIQRQRLRHLVDVAAQFGERALVPVLGDRAQDVVEQDEAGDVLGVVAVDGQAREAVAPQLGERIGHGMGLGQRTDHDPRRQDVAHLQRAEVHQVAEHLRFLVAEHALLCPLLGHGVEFLATEYVAGGVACEQARDRHAHDDQRVQRAHHQSQQHGRGRCQLAPVARAQRLRDDLGQHQDQEGQDRRGHADVTAAEYDLRLCADPGRTDGVRDGVERQDRRERALDVRLQRLQPFPRARAALLVHGDVRRRDRQQHGLEDGAQE
jgi:hypothetical protein